MAPGGRITLSELNVARLRFESGAQVDEHIRRVREAFAIPPGDPWGAGMGTASYWTINAPESWPEETPEQRQARREQEERQQAEWARRVEESRGAEERANGLLKQRLGAWRYRLFSRSGALMIRSKRWPDVTYRVPKNLGDRVGVIRSGRVETELCVVTANNEPAADRTMTILDLLETDEMKLWEMANVFPRHQP